MCVEENFSGSREEEEEENIIKVKRIWIFERFIIFNVSESESESSRVFSIYKGREIETFEADRYNPPSPPFF